MDRPQSDAPRLCREYNQQSPMSRYKRQQQRVPNIEYRPVKNADLTSKRANRLTAALVLAQTVDLAAVSESAFSDLITHSVHHHLRTLKLPFVTKKALQNLIIQKGSRVPSLAEALGNEDLNELLQDIELLAHFGHPLAIYELAKYHRDKHDNPLYLQLLAKAAVQIAILVDQHQFQPSGLLGLGSAKPFSIFGSECAQEAAQILIDYAFAVSQGKISYVSATTIHCLLRAEKLLGHSLTQEQLQQFDTQTRVGLILAHLSKHPNVTTPKNVGFRLISQLLSLGKTLEDQQSVFNHWLLQRCIAASIVTHLGPKVRSDSKTGFRTNRRSEIYQEILEALLNADPELQTYADQAIATHKRSEKIEHMQRSREEINRYKEDIRNFSENYNEALAHLFAFAAYEHLDKKYGLFEFLTEALQAREKAHKGDISQNYLNASRDTNDSHALDNLCRYASDGDLTALSQLALLYQDSTAHESEFYYAQLVANWALCGDGRGIFDFARAVNEGKLPYDNYTVLQCILDAKHRLVENDAADMVTAYHPHLQPALKALFVLSGKLLQIVNAHTKFSNGPNNAYNEMNKALGTFGKEFLIPNSIHPIALACVPESLLRGFQQIVDWRLDPSNKKSRTESTTNYYTNTVKPLIDTHLAASGTHLMVPLDEASEGEVTISAPTDFRKTGDYRNPPPQQGVGYSHMGASMRRYPNTPSAHEVPRELPDLPDAEYDSASGAPAAPPPPSSSPTVPASNSATAVHPTQSSTAPKEIQRLDQRSLHNLLGPKFSTIREAIDSSESSDSEESQSTTITPGGENG